MYLFFQRVVSLSGSRCFVIRDFFTQDTHIRVSLSQLLHAALHYSIKHVLIMHSGILKVDHHNNGTMNRAYHPYVHPCYKYLESVNSFCVLPIKVQKLRVILKEPLYDRLMS